jgi:hypothetical protein
MVPGEAAGEGRGLSLRNKGWICVWSWFSCWCDGRRLRDGAKGGNSGESGTSSASSSASQSSMKGPSRGYAGDTGLLPGIVSSLCGCAARRAVKASAASTVSEVVATFQVSNPSEGLRSEIESERTLSDCLCEFLEPLPCRRNCCTELRTLDLMLFDGSSETSENVDTGLEKVGV